jgi:beta-phosphoglucomutase-like phosphatase (HAD superfamily)
VALLEDMAAGGHRLAMLSNAPAEVATAVMTLPVAALFEHCLFSCFLGLVKPDPAIYRAVLERLGASPADVIFLDDRPDNVSGALELGIRGVVFTDPGTARAELASLGVATGSASSPGSKPVPSDLFWTILGQLRLITLFVFRSALTSGNAICGGQGGHKCPAKWPGDDRSA